MKYLLRYPLFAVLSMAPVLVPVFGQQSVQVPRRAPVVAARGGALRELSDAIETLSREKSRAVVQIFSTGYVVTDSEDAGGGAAAGLVTKQSSSGSGVVLSPDGYIVTNNHVVRNARRIRVQLASTPDDPATQAAGTLHAHGKLLEAKVVGVDRETDLAVLKIDAGFPLPVLQFGDSDNLRQGQVALAFGNPLGLENSVSMGIVSSVGRQVKPDDPIAYIQTDAPINPGNSGGPLLDVDGNVVGINTFIFTQSGGSEGIGFAIPSNIVMSIYEQIRADGHVHRGEIGVAVQVITPELAAGLDLKQDTGVIIADVSPGGPADQGGLTAGDIIISFNGRPVASARQLQSDLYRIRLNQVVDFEVLRGNSKLETKVKVGERENDPFRFVDQIRPEENRVPKLGIVGIAITQDVVTSLPQTRKPYGVIVAARSGEAEYTGEGGLKLGDVIYSVNTTPVSSLAALREAVDGRKPDEPLVLQIEREGKLAYLILSQE